MTDLLNADAAFALWPSRLGGGIATPDLHAGCRLRSWPQGDRDIGHRSAASGDPIGEPLDAHDDGVEAVAFNPDDTLLATAGGDGTVRLSDDDIRDVAEACRLAMPYVTAHQVAAYLPQARTPRACELE